MQNSGASALAPMCRSAYHRVLMIAERGEKLLDPLGVFSEQISSRMTIAMVAVCRSPEQARTQSISAPTACAHIPRLNRNHILADQFVEKFLELQNILAVYSRFQASAAFDANCLSCEQHVFFV